MARSHFEDTYYMYDLYRGRGGRDRDVFEVRLDRNMNRDSLVVRMRSRRFEVELAYELSYRYTRDIDPRGIVDYAQQVIGAPLQAWAEAHVDNRVGCEMARALVPHWQRLIQEWMERLEYEGRQYRGRGYHFYMQGVAPFLGSFRPSEDPKAKEKARQLLMRNLDEGQLKSFKKDGWFYVTGADGLRYKVSTARSFNVEAPDGTAYCGQLTDTPVEDQMLAQKLLLQDNPQEFMKKSNKRPPISFRAAAAEGLALTIDERILRGLADAPFA